MSGHSSDEITGPFYDTSGLIRWLGITRQALHQQVARYAILSPLDGVQACRQAGISAVHRPTRRQVRIQPPPG
jgi:hypothetical protein